MSDLAAFALFSAVLLAAVGVGEGLRAVAGWRAESTRRVVHAGVGVATALCPPLFSGPGPIYVLAGLFVAANGVAMERPWFPAMHGIGRPSIGTVLFPSALVVALFLCWTMDAGRVFVLQTAFLVLGLADPAASFVGTRLRRPGRYVVAGHPKSVAGSVTFAVVAAAVTAAMLAWLAPVSWGPAQIATGAFVVAAVGTACEALGRGGWDNFLVVLAVVVPLSALDARPEDAALLGWSVIGSVVFGVVAYRARALDLSGALAGSVLAWMLLALGGPAWAVPAVAFFVLSSAWSRAGRGRKGAAEALAEKGSRRDAGQVAANGAVAAALLAGSVFWPHPALYAGFLGAFAAAAADTWATELGTLVRGPTRRLGVGPRVPPGTSGGVSLAGTLGAVAGAGSVFTAAAPFLSDTLPGVGAAAVALLIVGAGVAGAFLDTFLGATVQARYRRADGGLTERSTEEGQALPLAGGFATVTNDRVNLLCTLAGGGLAFGVLNLL